MMAQRVNMEMKPPTLVPVEKSEETFLNTSNFLILWPKEWVVAAYSFIVQLYNKMDKVDLLF